MIEKISLITGVSIPNIFSKCRKYEFVEARQLYCYSLRKHFTLYQIGTILNINHSTVFHSVKVINRLIGVKDKRTLFLINQLEKLPSDLYKLTDNDKLANKF